MESQYFGEEYTKNLDIILEGVEEDDKKDKKEETEDVVKKDEGIGGGESGEGGQSEEENPELDEGALGNLATKVAKTVGSVGADVVKGLAKGAIEGVLGPKDVRLMKTASKAFVEVLANNGIKTSEEKVSNVLSKLLARSILKKRESSDTATKDDEVAAKPSEKPAASGAANDIRKDAILALKSLGIKNREASAKIDNILSSNKNIALEDLIKQALQK